MSESPYTLPDLRKGSVLISLDGRLAVTILPDKEKDMFTYLPWEAGQYRLQEMGIKDYFDDSFEEMRNAGFTGASIGVKFVWED